MNWLERYVEGVKRCLPRKNREDVGEEIMSVLVDKVEAEEENLGRKMNENELKEWVNSLDHPIVLAAGYQERRELVTAELFLLYTVALKIALAIIFSLKVISTGFYILGPGEFEFSYIWDKLFGGLLVQGLLAFASITLVFHFLGRHISAHRFFEKWKAKDLPLPGSKWMTVSVGELIFETIVYIFALGFVNSGFIGAWDFWWSDAIALNTEIFTLIPWINAVIVLSIVFNIWVIARPHLNVPKIATNIGLGLFGLWVLGMVLAVDPILSFDQAFVTDHPNIDRGKWLNRTVTYSLYVVGVIYIYELIRDAYRIYKLRS